MLTAPGRDRILGATIVGEHAGELIVEFVAAMKHGIGLNKILGTIHIYPTLAEAYKIAALDAWNRMPRRQPSSAAFDDAKAALERFARAARAG